MSAKDTNTRKSTSETASPKPADPPQTDRDPQIGKPRPDFPTRRAPASRAATDPIETPTDASLVGGIGEAAVLGAGQITRAGLPDTFADERDDVLTVINELEDQLDRYEEIRESLERELIETREQNQTAKQRVQELEWQAVTLQTRVEALEQIRQEISLLEEEIADANSRAQRLTEQLSRSEKENTRITNELKSASKQLEELWSARKERDGLRVDIKNLSAKLDHLDRVHKDTLEERGALHSKLQEAQAALEETRGAKHELEMNLRAADDRNEELLHVEDELKQKIETLRVEKKNCQAQLTHMERENARLVEQQQFFECELTSLRSMNRNAESALANVKKAFSEVRIALAETKTRARRRAIETWPRGRGTLRGLEQDPDADAETDEAIDESMAMESVGEEVDRELVMDDAADDE